MADGGLISAGTGGDGAAGSVNVNTETLSLTGGAQISSESGISPVPEFPLLGTGNAGQVTVTASDTVTIDGDGSAISTRTLGQGAGGKINVFADNLEIRNGGAIKAESLSEGADAGAGGNIKLTVNDTVLLRRGEIRTRVLGAGERAKGGDINIDPEFVILLDGSRIITDSAAEKAGDVSITAGLFIISSDSRISAQGGDPSLDGEIEIRAPDTNISGTITPPPASFFKPSVLSSGQCGTAAGGASSLTAAERGPVPADPDGYLMSIALGPGGEASGAGSSPETENAVDSDGFDLTGFGWGLAMAQADCRL